MKKGLWVLLCIMLIGMLCACGQGRSIQVDDTTFLVTFQNACDADIYSIHYEYYLGETPVGGGEMGNADGSVIERDDAFTKDFIGQDFPEDAGLSEFWLEIFIVDHYKNEYPCGAPVCFAPAYGETYCIELSGDFLRGFSARMTGEDETGSGTQGSAAQGDEGA